MSEFKGTPGPWHPGHLGSDGKCQCRYVVDEGYAGGVCTIHVGNSLPIGAGGNDAPPLEQAIANMHLIAAAPELLVSASMALSVMEVEYTTNNRTDLAQFMDPLRAAIAKALGEEK